MDERNKQVVCFVVQCAISILTALGVTNCMAAL